ncbi:MAG: hypothetical protein OT477_10680 [Chloroflexi bacterium]|nr:hypothetical protein [Chloroflexota bacterium]
MSFVYLLPASPTPPMCWLRDIVGVGRAGITATKTIKRLLPPDPPAGHTPRKGGVTPGVGGAGETAACFSFAPYPRPPPHQRINCATS